MSVQEIFTTLASHMVEGMMLHEQLLECYLFLGFYGNSKCHEYRYLDETLNYIRLTSYAIDHQGFIITSGIPSDPKIIPENWMGKDKFDVTYDVRHKAIKVAAETWVKWERDTKALYEASYQNLMTLGEVAASDFINSFIEDVDEELKIAEKDLLKNLSMDFDLPTIADSQDKLYKKYSKLISSLGIKTHGGDR